MEWKIYILMSQNGQLYTGIARDVEKRFYEHLENKQKGAKFFRRSPPLTLLYMEYAKNRSVASSREYQIKQLTRWEKELLIESYFNNSLQYLETD